MTEEIWKDIEGYEGIYQVSSLGRVRSLDRSIIDKSGKKQSFKGVVLKEFKNKQGYLYLDLCKNGKHKTVKVHRLVANAFIENPEDKAGVNHIDGIKTNNTVENLEWATVRENTKHAYEIGLAKSNRTKLTEEEIKEIRRIYSPKDKNFNLLTLAKMFKVSKSAIWNIVKNKTYKNI